MLNRTEWSVSRSGQQVTLALQSLNRPMTSTPWTMNLSKGSQWFHEQIKLITVKCPLCKPSIRLKWKHCLQPGESQSTETWVFIWQRDLLCSNLALLRATLPRLLWGNLGRFWIHMQASRKRILDWVVARSILMMSPITDKTPWLSIELVNRLSLPKQMSVKNRKGLAGPKSEWQGTQLVFKCRHPRKNEAETPKSTWVSSQVQSIKV